MFSKRINQGSVGQDLNATFKSCSSWRLLLAMLSQLLCVVKCKSAAMSCKITSCHIARSTVTKPMGESFQDQS